MATNHTMPSRLKIADLEVNLSITANHGRDMSELDGSIIT